ncbi:MAG: hypothetical protein ACI837_002713 [Crocinitomicaceae bacterium]
MNLSFKTLPKAPSSAFITTLAFSWDDLTLVKLTALLNWFKNFSEDENNWNQFGIFKLNHVANKEIHLIIQTAVSDDEASTKQNVERIEKQSAELKSICTHRIATRPILGHAGYFNPDPLKNTIKYTMYEAAQTLNSSGANQRGKYKSAYMRKEFSQDNIEVIIKQLHEVPTDLKLEDMAQSLLQVDSYGGKINTIDSSETPIPQRDSIFKLQYQTYWTNDKKDDAYLSWIRGFYSEIYKKSGGTPNPKLDSTDTVDGCYFNYPDSDLNEIVGKEGALELYFLENLDRLKKVKRQWDPNNYFNSAQSIPVEFDLKSKKG